MEIPEARHLAAVRATTKAPYRDTTVYCFDDSPGVMFRRIKRTGRGLIVPESHKLGVVKEGKIMGNIETYRLAEFSPWSPFED